MVTFTPELVLLVDFVFPWGIEYPVVFLPQGLFTLWCLQMANTRGYPGVNGLKIH
jgi:hypothetical protein